MGLLNITEAIAEESCEEREMNVDRFGGMFTAFNFGLGEGDINIKKKRIPIL